MSMQLLTTANYNYGDLTIWDRLFGTFRDTHEFAPECGFPNDNEKKILRILSFKDVYDDKIGSA